jgi:hypothetical protein
MNVVNPEVLAELDVSLMVLVLTSLLGAAIFLLLACVVARAGSEPLEPLALLPVTVGQARRRARLPLRELSRACGASRAPPGPPPRLHAGPLRIRLRR